MFGHSFAALSRSGVFGGGYFFHRQNQRPRVADRRFGFQQQQNSPGPDRGGSSAISSLAQSGDFWTTSVGGCHRAGGNELHGRVGGGGGGGKKSVRLARYDTVPRNAKPERQAVFTVHTSRCKDLVDHDQVSTRHTIQMLSKQTGPGITC